MSQRASEEECVKGFFGKAGRKETTRRPRHRWADVKMGPREVGWCAMDWIYLP
jgi:hypothetical protein